MVCSLYNHSVLKCHWQVHCHYNYCHTLNWPWVRKRNLRRSRYIKCCMFCMHSDISFMNHHYYEYVDIGTEVGSRCSYRERHFPASINLEKKIKKSGQPTWKLAFHTRTYFSAYRFCFSYYLYKIYRNQIDKNVMIDDDSKEVDVIIDPEITERLLHKYVLVLVRNRIRSGRYFF